MLDTKTSPEAGPDLDTGRSVIDPRDFRRAMGRFATGVTVITTRGPDGKREGLTANSFSSVSLDPPLVLFCLGRHAASLPGFMAADWFAVHVLAGDQQALAMQFATRAADKFAGIDPRPGLGGCPVLDDCLARFECSVHDRVPAGDHVILLGRVERMSHRDGEPLLYSGGRFCGPSRD